MLRTTRPLAAIGAVTRMAGLGLGLVVMLPAPARAMHAVSIQKVCLGPGGVAKARPGDTVACDIKITNRDTFGDTLRVDQIVDVVEDLGGPTTTPNLIATQLGLACVLLAPGASVIVSHDFVAGNPENDPLGGEAFTTGADLRNAGGPIPPGCPAGGMEFDLSFGAQVDIVECFGDADCATDAACGVDVCDATTDACLHTAAPDGTLCRAAAGVCDLEERCTGASRDCPADAKRTTVCRSSTGVCDPAEQCDGVGDDCPADTLASSATVCRSAGGVCDAIERCTGGGPACPPDAKKTGVCRTAAGVCDVAEQCDGVGDGCPPDVFVPATNVCRSAAGVCDLVERCTGSAAACPPDAKSTDLCRASTGVCDLEERCDGAGNACPSDRFVSPGTVCRSAAGVCDAVEACTGAGAACPADAKRTDTCRKSVDVCDVAEICPGTGNDCPPDGFAPTTVMCRGALGTCDVSEMCPGTGPSCPADVRQASGTVCRSSAGTCDPGEICNGTDVACPPDARTLNGTPCPDDGSPCTSDLCNGTSPACTHPPGNAGLVCRSASGQCDVAEQCTGTDIACPPDRNKGSGAKCTADSDACTVDQCDGSGSCKVVGPSTDPACDACGAFGAGPCVVTVDGVLGVFSTLQAGVNAAPNGGTIHVSGVCKGVTLVKKRSHLTIEGTAPATCPPTPGVLMATLQGDPNATPPSGSNGEVLKILTSDYVVVRYLNIVNGGDHDGLEYKTSASGTAYCNCVAKNDEGYELDAPGGHQASVSLVTSNHGTGIHLHAGQTGTYVVGNIVELNEKDGIGVVEASHDNEISANICRNNTGSGILLDNGDLTRVLGNDVFGNLVAGIRLKSGANGNTVGSAASPNTIHGNGDGLTNFVLCVGDLTGNAGTNVPATPACQ